MSEDDTWGEDGFSEEEIAASEATFAALASGQPLSGDPVVEMLSALRGDLEERSSRAPVVPLDRGRTRRRLGRGAVAGVVVAGIAFSGTGVAAALSSEPGSFLYPVRTAITGPVDDPHRQMASRLVEKTQQLDATLKAAGPSAAPAVKSAAAKDLAAAASLVPQVKDPGRKKTLVKQIQATQELLGLPPSPVPTSVASPAEASPSLVDPSSSATPSGAASDTPSPDPSASGEPSTSPDPSDSPTPSTTPSPSVSPSPKKHKPSPSPSKKRKPTKSPRPTPSKARPSRSPKPSTSTSASPRFGASTPAGTSASPHAAEATPSATPSPTP